MNREEIRNTDDAIQPQKYSAVEIAKLKEFVEAVQNDDTRSVLACWGDHSDYSHGY